MKIITWAENRNTMSRKLKSNKEKINQSTLNRREIIKLAKNQNQINRKSIFQSASNKAENHKG